MAFYQPEDIAHNSLLTVEGADRFLFGILQSRPFTLWAGTVSGRLGSGIRISPDLSYNSFPLPEATSDSKKQVEIAAGEVLAAREAANATLEDLYDSVAMPPALVRAHDQLDSAVMRLFGLKDNQSDAEVLSVLFERYEELTAPLTAAMATTPKKRYQKRYDSNRVDEATQYRDPYDYRKCMGCGETEHPGYRCDGGID